MRKILLVSAIASTILVAGCTKEVDYVDQEISPAEKAETRTHVIFNPAFSEMPIPNDFLYASDPDGDGTMFAGFDPANPVIAGLDALDGASVLSPFDIAFDGSLDPDQTLDAANFIATETGVIPNPNQNVFLLPLTYAGGDSLLQASVNGIPAELPTFAEFLTYQIAGATLDFATLGALAAPAARAEIISQDGGINNVLRITPLKPLMPKTKYLVAITNLQDPSGNPVYPSRSYEALADPDVDIGVAALRPVQAAVRGWELLAGGYFAGMRQTFSALGVTAEPPLADDLIFTMTFTTTGTDSILKSVAAPETFFEESLRIGYKQDAISKLASGVYNLNGDNSALTDPTDIAINTTLNTLVTSPTIPTADPEVSFPNPLYNPLVANSVTQAGATYADFAVGPFAYQIQLSAAEAAITVHDSGSPFLGDAAPYVNIATEAAGTVSALAAAVAAPVEAIFPVAAPRATNFFRADAASAINAGLIAPAGVYQGEITLPVFQEAPSGGDGSVLKTSAWVANATIGGILDAAQMNAAGTTPPSSKVTHRYPFPTKVSDQTVPLVVTMPDEATLGAFGITKPAEGWPVIIYIHGITSERSATLPIANALSFACVLPDLSGPSGADCFATVALDLPLHGVEPGGSLVPGLFSVNDPDNPIVPNLPAGSPNTPSAGLTERHYNFTADATANPVAMDYSADLGDSGSLFINLSNFENGRDSLRQMVLDLLNLNASLDSMDVNADGTADDLDPARVYFIGHSLGGIAGIPFVAINNDPAVQASPFSTLPKVQAASFMLAGGALPRMLTHSQAFAPSILPGLAFTSDVLAQGQSGLESYLNVFQGVLDSVDAMNFASKLSDANSDTGVLLTEVIGDGTDAFIPDTVIPNGADSIWGPTSGPLSTVVTEIGFVIDSYPAPLAGTEPLIAQFGAIPTASATSDGDPAVLVTRFTQGSHGTPVDGGANPADPYSTPASFAELLSQLTTFFTLNGDVAASIVANPDVVE